MAVMLNHTIVNARDKRVSADFLTSLFGLPPARAWGPFLAVETANDVGLDFYDTEGEIASQHYCFLVSEDDFDQIFGRIQAQAIPYWADPGHSQPGTHNTHDGRPRPVLRRPERAQPRDHHATVRRRTLVRRPSIPTPSHLRRLLSQRHKPTTPAVVAPAATANPPPHGTV